MADVYNFHIGNNVKNYTLDGPDKMIVETEISGERNERAMRQDCVRSRHQYFSGTPESNVSRRPASRHRGNGEIARALLSGAGRYRRTQTPRRDGATKFPRLAKPARHKAHARAGRQPESRGRMPALQRTGKGGHPQSICTSPEPVRTVSRGPPARTLP